MGAISGAAEIGVQLGTRRLGTRFGTTRPNHWPNRGFDYRPNFKLGSGYSVDYHPTPELFGGLAGYPRLET